jgi:thiol-disulfide isomerase/thioredoxin
MHPGQFLLRLGWLGTYVQTQHDDFDAVMGQGMIPIVHDQDLFVTEARLALDVGLTERFSASLMVPVRVVSTSIVYRDGSGTPVELVRPSTHHRDETLSGLSDPMVLGAVTHVLAGTRLVARAGLTIPLGRTEEDPFALGAAGMQHQHIQMGTGTVNPVLALEASRSSGAWRAGGYVFTQQVVYENSRGYQAGDRYAAGLSLRRALGQRWSVRGGPELQAETAERWHGVRYTEEGNQGRIDAILGVGAAWMATRTVTVDVAVKVPLYTHVVGGQLEAPAIVELGVAWAFGSAAGTKAIDDHDHGDDHDHDHEHEHDHDDAGHHDVHAHDGDAAVPPPADHGGADVRDLGENGERVELVAVPGKLTIFDFWATWCEPCKTLEPALIELARAHPDRVAVRRIDVVDWDSAVAAQHLTPGGFGLPHLKILDTSGKLVLEKSSAPGKLQALIDEVRALVDGKPTAATPPPPSQPVATTPAPPEPRPAAKSAPAKPRATATKPLVIAIDVTRQGFTPRDIEVPSGRPIVLRFHRTFDKTCATEVVFEHDGKRVLKDLPLGKVVEVPVTFEKRGRIGYGCAMNKMIGGTITVE